MPLVRTLRRFEKPAAALAVASLAFVAHAQSFGPAHVRPVLAVATRGAPAGGTLTVALVETIDPGWHTYWRNPGDAGEPTRIAWSLPAGWRAGDIVWPAPRRLPVGPLMNFGYVGQVVLPTSIAVPADARPGSVAHIAAKVSMLVCADVCVPQDADLALDAPVTRGPAPADPVWGRAIAATIAAAPHPEGLAGAWGLAGGRLRLSVAGRALAGRSVDYFFPVSAGLIDAAKPETIERGPRGVTVLAVAGQALAQGPPPRLVEGVLTTSDGEAFEVAAAQGPALAGAGADGAGARPAMGLALAAVGAFLGGLILNLMPCVFPILSMKAAALIARPPGAAGSRRQGLAFLVGVMAAFLLLAGAIIGLRAAGQSVGWGTQLQPAAVTAVLALILLAAALDLSGVFEVGASLQGLGGGLAGHADLLGAFFTGALAVVVAAPCTAPFMGPALGWALTQPAAEALIVFAALGLGFAAPFTALAFNPRLLRRLPRPGPWTDVLRKALAFPLYGAAGWLLWVLAAQTDRRGPGLRGLGVRCGAAARRGRRWSSGGVRTLGARDRARARPRLRRPFRRPSGDRRRGCVARARRAVGALEPGTGRGCAGRRPTGVRGLYRSVVRDLPGERAAGAQHRRRRSRV
jgi:DsbC/DsbD-like thiol-disulfide interchange protein/cytochrome c biogenesis protein CcdA